MPITLSCLLPTKTASAQKMKFCIKDFFSKCDEIRSFQRIWSHLMKKSLMENCIFCVVHLYHQMMMNELMMMNCFCRMVNWRKTFSFRFNVDHCQRFSPSQISDTLWAGFESAHNLSLDFVQQSCAIVLTTTKQRREWCVMQITCNRLGLFYDRKTLT